MLTIVYLMLRPTLFNGAILSIFKTWYFKLFCSVSDWVCRSEIRILWGKCCDFQFKTASRNVGTKYLTWMVIIRLNERFIQISVARKGNTTIHKPMVVYNHIEVITIIMITTLIMDSRTINKIKILIYATMEPIEAWWTPMIKASLTLSKIY